MKEMTVTLKNIKDFRFVSDPSVNDLYIYDDRVFVFIGYEYGTYPIGKDIETGETFTLPHY